MGVTQTLDERIAELAGVLESEVISHQGASIPFGEIDWTALARVALRHLAKDVAIATLIGQGAVQASIPMRHTCQCANPIIKHEFGRGSHCVMCGLPA